MGHGGRSAEARPKMLSAAFVKTVTRPGRYGDGRGGYGLSLLVKPMASGRLSRTWSQRVRIAGRPANIGLGRYPIVSLSEARAAALKNARAIAQGQDVRGGGVPTFAEAVEKVIEIHRPTWKDGARSGDIWRSSLVPLIFDFFKKLLVIWGHRGLERCAVRTASPSRGSRRLFSST